MELKEACELYVNNLRIIRQLSTISNDITLDEESFYNEMVENFLKIREYASQIQQILNNTLLPVLAKGVDISKEDTDVLWSFVDELINGYSMHNLDLEVVAKCVEKLLEVTKKNDDVNEYIKALDTALTTYYTLMNKSERIYEQVNVKENYRKLGKDASVKVCEYLNKDKFNTLSDDIKLLVLIDSRYRTALHEAVFDNPKDNEDELRELYETIAVAKDDFYKESLPSFDIDVHKAACGEYAGYMLERCNAKNLTKEQAQWVYNYILELKQLRNISPLTKERISDQEFSLLYVRSAYFSGNMSADDYINNLWAIYKRRKSGYDISAIFTNLLIPVEYLMIINKLGVVSKYKKNLERMYDDLLDFVINKPDSEIMSYVLEYFSLILDNYIEYDDLMSFKDFSLKALAALHLPTYIHSTMVAKISWFITGKYIEYKPSILDELNMTKEELLDYVYTAGLLHDVGKLPVIDTVYVYERKLFDTEFAVLKTHSTLGYNLLKKYESTKKYAKIAYSHHIWNSKTGGYPLSIELSPLEQFATDVIRCADCMDAATDVVGRSYSGGITLEQYFEEYKAGAGKLYAPYLAELYTKEFVDEYDKILKHERKQSYFSAFNFLLKS